MTIARWTSLIAGIISDLLLSYSTAGKPPNIRDFLIVLSCKAVTAAMILIPLILEYKERQSEKNLRDQNNP